MIAYAWSNYKMGNQEKAETVFKSMDSKYSNYQHRLEYIIYLNETHGVETAKNKMTELINEINSMDSYERKLNRQVIAEIKKYNKQLF